MNRLNSLNLRTVIISLASAILFQTEFLMLFSKVACKIMRTSFIADNILRSNDMQSGNERERERENKSVSGSVDVRVQSLSSAIVLKT